MRALRFAVAPALVTPIMAMGATLLMVMLLLLLRRGAIALGFVFFRLLAWLRRGAACRLAVAVSIGMRLSGALAIMAFVLLAPLLAIPLLRVRPIPFALIGLTLSVPCWLILVALTVMLWPVRTVAIAIPAPLPMTLRAGPGFTFRPLKFGLRPAKPPNLFKFDFGTGCRRLAGLRLCRRCTGGCRLGGLSFISPGFGWTCLRGSRDFSRAGLGRN
jgi:hypothetical protein